MFDNIYKGKTVLVTGHTGFKGSWLAFWLQKLGARVVGYSLPPVSDPSHYRLLGGLPIMGPNQNLLDYTLLERFMWINKPDLVFHLAAKAIVARTFKEPRETFVNNVNGAVNILEACRHTSVKGIIMITTDKVYANKEWSWGYRENDELGGLDPYSASKVCVEHVIECYRTQFLPQIATARAGNVIGGGDWSYARLIPDIVRATVEGKKVEIHTPTATRPWQHVLEPLCGYLLLGKALLEGKTFGSAFNFGPIGQMTVLDIVRIARDVWPAVKYEVKVEETHPSMVTLLKIDSTKAQEILGWRPRWTMEQAVRTTVNWYRAWYEFGILTTEDDIEDYERTMENEV